MRADSVRRAPPRIWMGAAQTVGVRVSVRSKLRAWVQPQPSSIKAESAEADLTYCSATGANAIRFSSRDNKDCNCAVDGWFRMTP